MNTVGAANARRVFMLHRAGFQRRQQTVHISEQQVRRADQLDVETRVQNIRRRHALMYKAGHIRTNMLGQMRQKRDNVVLGDSFDLVNTGHIKLNVFGFPNGLGILARDHTQIGHRIASMRLDLIPDFEFRFWGPDSNHVGAGITRDHMGRPYFVIGQQIGLGHKGQNHMSQGKERENHPYAHRFLR